MRYEDSIRAAQELLETVPKNRVMKSSFVAVVEQFDNYGHYLEDYQIIGVFDSKSDAQKAINNHINKIKNLHYLNGVIKEV